ncbi:MAG: Glu-tRNA(Gln) amidotransferase subunit GatD, partial [Nitrosopumilus sp. (ex Thoosa mismalolli)]|nr:Glu-tRNA(Gln) amidotransferase subunit GatD [Nitrosopumilus sp. (ex Thoosa mismalolli)]
SENISQTSEQITRKEGLPKILLLSTGGTIASKVDYRTGAVTPVLTAQELNSSVPELSEIANVDAEVLLSEYSENIMPENWLEIANKIKEFEKSDYSGIIVAHGTDTMHYTSSFLSFALAGFPIPIVLVGSQRSSDRASSDAALNLIGATKFITEAKTRGVYIVMHQDENDDTVACHIGTRVRKNHTSKRGAFQTIGDDPAFIIAEEQIQKNMNKDFFSTRDFQPKIKLNTKVALVKYHPGYDPKILEQIIDSGINGIIFEGTGLGHVGKIMYESVKKAKEKGIFLGMTSQCIDGRVRMTVYESGRDLLNLGIIPLENMVPEVALVKAMWVLGNYENSEEIKEIMLENIASELTN